MLGKKSDSETQKALEVDASFQGHLTFKDAVNLRINGYFEGMLETKGELWIGEHAVVKASISGDKITVAGSVAGELTASSEIRLVSTAKVKGALKAPSLNLEKGCLFDGEARMTPDPEIKEEPTRRIFLTVDEVANYLSVEAGLVFEWAESGKIPGAKNGEGWKFEKRRVDEWIAKGRVS